MKRLVRHLISIDDLTDGELRAITARGADLAAASATGNAPGNAAGNAPGRPLDGQVVGIYFRKTSTRTRTAFSAGALRMGAQIVTFGAGDLQTNTGETSEDTGRVLCRMLDALVARTADGAAELRAWAGQDRMAVVNAMTAEEHPTQALADLTTMLRWFGVVDGLRVLYVGEGNNTATALVRGLSRFRNTRLELRTPPGYGLPQDLLRRAQDQASAHGSVVTQRHDMDDLPGGFDVVYTTRWQTTGTSKDDPRWRAVFAPFAVTGKLWELNPDSVFMHDLPAHRGEEVTADVLDGPASIAFDQAENKMHSAMAVLEWCLCAEAGQ